MISFKNKFSSFRVSNYKSALGIGDGDWGLGIGPNPQSPIPNPQSPIPNLKLTDLKSFVSI